MILRTFIQILLINLLIIGNTYAWKFEQDSSTTVDIIIEEGSYLLINGKTNVNQFQCRYDDLASDGKLKMTVIYDDGCLYFKKTKLTLNTKNFYCENKLMTKDFQDLMQADKYPYISINVECIETGADNKVKNIPVTTESENLNITAAAVHANFQITDEVNNYRIPVEIQRDKNKRIYTGTMMVNIRDFGLEPPKKMLGMVQVDQWIEVYLYLIISLGDNS